MKTNIILQGDCIEKLKELPNKSIDAIITDPPYGLAFMGKEWDKFKEGKNIGGGTTGIGTPFGRSKPLNSVYQYGLKEKNQLQQFCYSWATECLRVLKPGGFLLSFGGTRTYHRMVCGIEDAGFEIRDTIGWIFGQGFPKSLNIGKQVDKIRGNDREVIGTSKNEKDFRDVGKKVKEIIGIDKLSFGTIENAERKDLELTKGNSEWEGWGTSVKPSNEPIVVAQKPLNTLTHIDILCRLIGYVKDVERSLKLKSCWVKRGEGNYCSRKCSNPARGRKGNLMEIGKVEDLKEVMDTLQFSQKEKDTNLNMILSWKNLLDEIYNEMNKSTTSMENEMTTELKILNSLLYQNIQNFIILEKSKVNGQQLNAQLVENLLKSMLLKLRSINIIFVQENVTRKELNLSPNCNPICVARKPLSEKNVALNVLKWGTGGINIDACRIGLDGEKQPTGSGSRVAWRNKEGRTDKTIKMIGIQLKHLIKEDFQLT